MLTLHVSSNWTALVVMLAHADIATSYLCMITLQ